MAVATVAPRYSLECCFRFSCREAPLAGMGTSVRHRRLAAALIVWAAVECGDCVSRSSGSTVTTAAANITDTDAVLAPASTVQYGTSRPSRLPMTG